MISKNSDLEESMENIFKKVKNEQVIKNSNHKDDLLLNKIKLYFPNKILEKESPIYLIINLFVYKKLQKGSLYCFYYGEQSYDITDYNQNFLEDKEKIKSKLKKIDLQKQSLKVIKSGMGNIKNSENLVSKNSLHEKLSGNDTFNKIGNDSFKERNVPRGGYKKNLKFVKKKKNYSIEKEKNQEKKIKEIPISKKNLKRKTYFLQKIYQIDRVSSECLLLFPLKIKVKEKNLLSTVNHSIIISKEEKLKFFHYFSNNYIKIFFSTDQNLMENKKFCENLQNPKIEDVENKIDFFSSTMKIDLLSKESFKKSYPLKSNYRFEKLIISCFKKKKISLNIDIQLTKSYFDLSKDDVNFIIKYPIKLGNYFSEIIIRIENFFFFENMKKISKKQIIYETSFPLKKEKSLKKKKDFLEFIDKIKFNYHQRKHIRTIKNDKIENSYKINLFLRDKKNNSLILIFDKPLFIIKYFNRKFFREDEIIKELDIMELRCTMQQFVYLMPFLEFEA